MQQKWTEALGAELAASRAVGKPDDADTYFEAALAALEGLLVANGSLTLTELNERQEAWEHAYLDTPHGQPVELCPLRQG